MKKPKHALLSASGSSRWLKCPPAPRLEEKLPEQASIYAEEGRFAHEYAELQLRHYMGEISRKTFNAKLKKLKENPLYTQLFCDYVNAYIDSVIVDINEAQKAGASVVLLEREVDYSVWAPEGFGTADVIIVSDNTLKIIDLKYGAGVPVTAEGNSQMRLYALGALEEFGCIYDIERIINYIRQPRLNIESCEHISVQELYKWGESIQPIADLAWSGKGEFNPGGHCQFCRAKCTCKARAEKNLELSGYDFRAAETLTDEEIVIILDNIDEMIAWGRDIQEYAFKRALAGHKWDGWKLVAGRSNRKYSDPVAIAEKLKGAGIPEDSIYKKELLGLTALESQLGKSTFYDLLGDLIIKPQGKPTLVRSSDERPEFDTAAEDFKEEYEEVS